MGLKGFRRKLEGGLVIVIIIIMIIIIVIIIIFIIIKEGVWWKWKVGMIKVVSQILNLHDQEYYLVKCGQ